MTGTFNPQIAIVNAKLVDIPLESRYSPKWWRKGLNVMLQNQLGKIHMEVLQ